MSKNRFMKKLLVAGLCALTATTAFSYAACGDDSSSNTKVPTGQEVTVEYSVNFNLDGGSGDNIVKQTVVSGGTATKPADPTKDGYTFTGWVLASDGTSFSFDTPITSDVTLKATWEAVTVTPPAGDENNGGSTEGGANNGESNNTPDNGNNEGNNGSNNGSNEGESNGSNNSGSEGSNEGNNSGSNEGSNDGNTEEGDDHSGMTLKTVTNTYSYSAISGISTDKAEVTSFTGANQFMTIDSSKGKVTYRTDAACIEMKGEAISVTFKGTGTLTLKVSSTGGSNTSNLMLKDADGNVVAAKSGTARTADDTVAEDCVNPAGSYEFSGTKDANATTYTFDITKAGTYTIYSNYYYLNSDKEAVSRGCRIFSVVMEDNYYVSDKSYNVSFVTGEGASTVESSKVVEGEKATKPADPTKSGYTFEGWYKNEECTEEFDFNTTISADTTVYAKWAEGSYVTLTEKFNAAELSAATYEDGWTDGTFAITENSTITGRNRTGVYDGTTSVDSTFAGTQCLKLGDSTSKLTVTIANAGKLTIYVENGSSGTTGTQSLVLTKPDGTTQEISYTANGSSSTIQKVVIDLEADGTYSIARKSGTSYVYYAEFNAQVKESAVASIKVVNAGTTKYYVGQSFNSTISVNAIHSTGYATKVTDYTINSSAFDSTKAGTYTITVTSGDFTTTYDVEVYSFDSLTLGTNAIVKESKNTSYGNGVYANHALRQFYFVGEDLDIDGLTIWLNGTNGSNSNSFKLSDTSCTITGYDKNTSGAQTVTVSFTTNVTETHSETFTVYVQAKASTLATASSVVLTVNADCEASNVGVVNVEGEYQFKTIQQAIDFLDNAGLSDNASKTIKLAAGTYFEKIEVNVANLTIEGAGASSTTIEYDSLFGVADESGYVHVTDSTATLNVREGATGFTLKNVTVSNSYNSLSAYANAKSSDNRALAVLIMADQVTVDNCAFLGFQDTLELFTGRQYISNTYISGTTDFIFGTNNTTYFKNCEIHTIANGEKGGYVTAFKGDNKSSSDAVTYGAIFDGCTFTAESGVPEGKTAIGRTWDAYSAVAVINSTLGAHISTDTSTSEGGRYVKMNGEPASAKFVEYNNTGAGAITDATGYACTILDETTAANYSNLSVIFGTTNGGVTYASAWSGTQGAQVTTKTYDFADFDKADEVTGTTETPTSLFNGDIEVVGSSRMNGNSVQVKQGTVITLKVQGEITVTWYGGDYGTAADGKITYKDGYATLTIVGTGNVYIVSITLNMANVPEDTVENGDGTEQNPGNENGEQKPETGDDKDVVVSYDYTKAATIDLSDYAGATIEGATGEYKGVAIDATSGKFASNSNGCVQVNAGTVLSINVAVGAEVKVNWYQTYGSADDVTIEYNAEHTVATLTVTGSNCYMVSIDVSYPATDVTPGNGDNNETVVTPGNGDNNETDVTPGNGETEEGPDSGEEGGEDSESKEWTVVETFNASDLELNSTSQNGTLYNDDYITVEVPKSNLYTGTTKNVTINATNATTALEKDGITFTQGLLPTGNGGEYVITNNSDEKVQFTIYYTLSDTNFSSKKVTSTNTVYLVLSEDADKTPNKSETVDGTITTSSLEVYSETVEVAAGESVTIYNLNETGSARRLILLGVTVSELQ